jgi:hypothetical protein
MERHKPCTSSRAARSSTPCAAIDGRAVYSCLVLAVDCGGSTITTIESLQNDPLSFALVGVAAVLRLSHGPDRTCAPGVERSRAHSLARARGGTGPAGFRGE